MKYQYLLANLPDYVEEVHKLSRHSVVRVSEEDLFDFVSYIYNHFQYQRLLDISFFKNQNEVTLWFMSLEEHDLIGVVCELKSDEQNILALNQLYLNFDSLAFSLNQSLGYELIKNLDDYYQKFAPYTPKSSVLVKERDIRVRDIIRINNHLNKFGDMDIAALSIDERVVELDFQVNDCHNQIAKKLSNMPIQSTINHLLKVDGYNAPSVAIGFCMALEEHLQLDIPDKAKAVRMIFLEFSRILESIEYISSLAYSIQAQYLYHKALFWLQKLERILVYYTGNIYHLGLFSLGGIMKDIQSGWITYCNTHLREIQEEINSEFELLTSSSLWRDRLVIAPSNPDDLLKWGLSGNPLRSAGLNIDLRKRKPYYFYDEVIFDVPVALKGNVFDKLLLSFLDLEQSFEIIFQVLDNIPTGPLVHPACDMSKMIREKSGFKLDDILLDGYVFHSLETFKGTLNFSMCIEDKKIKNLKVGNDNLSKLNYFKSYGVNQRIADISLVYRSLNINSSMMEL
tara:strand:- start:92070 stop:93605 length:1536 start_codon:yes stop_codon:yes gene_type:complete